MGCPIRDSLLVGYFRAQAIQAEAATAAMSKVAPSKHRSALMKSATARMDVIARRTELDAHCAEHGCMLHNF